MNPFRTRDGDDSAVDRLVPESGLSEGLDAVAPDFVGLFFSADGTIPA